MDLFDIYQQSKVQQANASAERAERNAKEAKDAVSKIERLEAQLDKLAMINRALWEYIKEDKTLTDEDLYRRVQAIDLSDGRLDGKMQREVKKCHNCGRTVNRRHQRCLYCGSSLLEPDVFDSL